MEDDRTILIAVSEQEHATLMAALAFYNDEGLGDPDNRKDDIHEIATNGDTVISLDGDGITALSEHINMGTTTTEVRLAELQKEIENKDVVIEAGRRDRAYYAERAKTLNVELDSMTNIAQEKGETIRTLKARVTELLNYNNAQVERRRVLARALRAIVEQAVPYNSGGEYLESISYDDGVFVGRDSAAEVAREALEADRLASRKS